MSDDADAAPTVPPTRVLTVLYCEVCGAPPEYCQWGPSEKRCRAWLKDKHPDLYEKHWGGADLSQDVAAIKLDDDDAAGVAVAAAASADASSGADAADKSGAAGKAKLDAVEKEELKLEKKRKASRVIIKRVERTKRKCVITIQGLENFGVDLKKAAKTFATKFACGSSVTKNPAGLDEIVIQGDVQDEVMDLITELWPAVPEDNIDLTSK